VPPLVLLLLTAAAPPGPALPPPAFTPGDEIVYAGEVHEASERIDLPYRRKSAIEVRLFTLAAGPDGADLAVLTSIRPLDDPHVAAAVKGVTGAAPDRSPAAVRLDLVRVDARGRVRRLAPPPGPPLPLTAATESAPPPPPPLDAAPPVEVGMFVPLPEKSPAVGESWEAADPGRPPAAWEAKAAAVWNGAQVVEAAGLQQSADWEKPTAGWTAWRRADRVWASPVDGLARVVHRQTERKENGTRVGWVVVRYEMKPPTPHRGESYQQVRKEVEYAYSFAAAADPLVPRAVELGPKPFEAIIARIDRYEADHPATAYREAVAAVRRRCEAAARGEVAKVVAPAVTTPAVGQPAPDFAAKDVAGAETFRLSGARGSPVVVVFYKPGSQTSEGALAVAEALYRKYAGKAVVVPLAVFADTKAARDQHAALKLTVPIRDGEAARQAYAVDTFPRFLLIDAGGVLRWQFEGYGAEVGYLVKTELERVLAGPAN
jgi:hypothetical protein